MTGGMGGAGPRLSVVLECRELLKRDEQDVRQSRTINRWEIKEEGGPGTRSSFPSLLHERRKTKVFPHGKENR